MFITVKILQGQECTIEVSASSSISAVKELVAEQLQIPVDQQRLVFRGKTLSDGLSLGDYNIVEGNKLHLFVRKASENTPSNHWSEMHRFLLEHFSAADADRVLEEYKKAFAESVASLSLDDIERLATSNFEGTSSAESPPERAPPPGKGRDPSTPVSVLLVDRDENH
ncbi:ubiquitin-like protein 4A [Ornithodoros turicata]|uniref:ubiquitin-like protein 4A n=1 Tax=Ornithodoros turicata TaxID=34597 RepID=UPI0031398156